MNNFWSISENIFDDGRKLVVRGALISGLSAVLLAILIFVFPALIGFIFATFILLAGLGILVIAYRAWKMKDRVRAYVSHYDPEFIPDVYSAPRYHYRRVTFIA